MTPESLAETLGFRIKTFDKFFTLVYKNGGRHTATAEEVALWNLCLELGERLRWIPVEEKLPEDGVTVLVSAIRGSGERWSVQSHHFGISGWYPLDDQSSATRPKITHWMYLPEEP